MENIRNLAIAHFCTHSSQREMVHALLGYSTSTSVTQTLHWFRNSHAFDSLAVFKLLKFYSNVKGLLLYI